MNDCTNNCNQIYAIKNPKSGYVWDSSEYYLKIQPFTGVPDQLWKVQCLGFGRFKIINQGSGKALDIENGKGPNKLITTEFSGADSQQWHINSDYTIVCPFGNYAVDIEREQFVPGDPLIAYPVDGAENQQFILTPA